VRGGSLLEVATKPATRQPTHNSSQALRRTSYPGVYRRGRRYVAVYRREGRQRKEAAGSFAEARQIKVVRDAEACAERLGPLLHDYALRWADAYAGAYGAIGEATRTEYRRLLITFALAYFPPETRLREIDRRDLQAFVNWIAAYRGSRGRLADRSIANAVAPLRLCLLEGEAAGYLESETISGLVVPGRRGHGASATQARFLTRAQLRCLLDQIPAQWSGFFSLLASTGLRVSEAIALRWMDLAVEGPPHLWVRRAIVGGVVKAPKSRYGIRRLPLGRVLVSALGDGHPADDGEESLVFSSRRGTPLNPNNLRSRVLAPAAKQAGLSGIGFHAFRHTCASLLIERGLSPLRLQRWMGHHSAAYTLDVYGHLIDAELASPLDLDEEL
jgi:integrase